VKAAAKEREEALQDVQNLRKERLLERLFVDARHGWANHCWFSGCSAPTSSTATRIW
jgi:hypothetical protein